VLSSLSNAANAVLTVSPGLMRLRAALRQIDQLQSFCYFGQGAPAAARPASCGDRLNIVCSKPEKCFEPKSRDDAPISISYAPLSALQHLPRTSQYARERRLD